MCVLMYTKLLLCVIVVLNERAFTQTGGPDNVCCAGGRFFEEAAKVCVCVLYIGVYVCVCKCVCLCVYVYIDASVCGREAVIYEHPYESAVGVQDYICCAERERERERGLRERC